MGKAQETVSGILKNMFGLGIKRKFNRVFEVASGVWEYNFVSKTKVLAPKEMIINLTYWCNSRCTMCNIWKIRPKQEMMLEDWIKIINDPIFNEMHTLTVSGGEATMKKDFVPIMLLYIEKFPKLKNLGLITNGFATDHIVKSVEEIAIACNRKKINFNVSVSLDGIKEMHEQVRGIKDGFAKTTATILKLRDMLKKYNFSVGSGSIIVKQNIARIADVEKWYQENNIDHSYQIVGFHDTFVRNLDTQKSVDYGNSEKQMLIDLLEKFSKPKHLLDFRSYYWKDMLHFYRDKTKRTTPCPFLTNQMVIDSFGDVYYCLSVKAVGNFLKEKRTIDSIYRDAKNIEFRKRLPSSACRRCNSGCNVNVAIASDFKKYLWYRLTGKLWSWSDI